MPRGYSRISWDQLATKVEEAARSTEEGVKHFIEPAQGTLRRATSKRHHVVFGRRGSGKSSLLRKAASDLTVDRRPIAYVDLEAFKGHSYPDVLLSVLIATFREFKEWIDSATIHPATKVSFWKRLFGAVTSRPSFNRRECAALSETLQAQIARLEEQLHRPEQSDLAITTASQNELEGSVELSADLAVVPARASAAGKGSVKRSEEVHEQYSEYKIDFLHRHILDYERVFQRMAILSGGDSFLFLDDLYHIRRPDQPKVLDYFHRIAKGQGLWLKVGTIRHRTDWYFHRNPPVGLKLGDDADEIDLDITLEKYALAKQFLLKILTNFANEVRMAPISIFGSAQESGEAPNWRAVERLAFLDAFLGSFPAFGPRCA